MRRVVSGKWVLPPSMRMSPGSSSGAISLITSSTGGPGLDHDHDLARPLQRGDEILDGVAADDLLPLASAVDEVVDLGGRAVEDGHGEAVALHVQDEVLAHHGQADQADVGGRGRGAHCGSDNLSNGEDSSAPRRGAIILPKPRLISTAESPAGVDGLGNAAERRRAVDELLARVGMPRDAVARFPFEFSGGQRQRIGIARALALRPRLIICDEPVSALDVSIQSQVINLLLDLQREFKLSYLFIAHNLAVVKHVSDRIAVMYLGRIVELGESDQVYANPRHPYTRALIAAIPEPDPARTRARAVLAGDSNT